MAIMVFGMKKMKKVKPEVMPGKPPKWYKEDKAISLFIYPGGKECIELAKITITSQGVYVYPLPQKIQRKSLFQESFHVSGKTHLKIKISNKKKYMPGFCDPQTLHPALKMWLLSYTGGHHIVFVFAKEKD